MAKPRKSKPKGAKSGKGSSPPPTAEDSRLPPLTEGSSLPPPAEGSFPPPLAEGSFPSPLSDPILLRMCVDVDTIGLGLYSFVNAVLADKGFPPISRVVAVNPQRVELGQGQRGYRVDVEALTETGERVLIEVQLSTFKGMNERSMLYAQGQFDRGSETGEALGKVVGDIPRVIVVNILDYVLRPSGRSFPQVVLPVYLEAPFEVAFRNLVIHHLQLPLFRKIALDLSNPLHCWLRAFCLAQDHNKSMKEVVMGEPKLKEYYDDDPGFKQFVDRHWLVAGDPDARHAYFMWRREVISRALELRGIMEEGIAEGEAKGRAERDLEIALKAFNKARRLGEDFSIMARRLRDLGISSAAVKAARKQVESKRPPGNGRP